MDTTKKYIVMCGKATNLQKLRGDGFWRNGDFYSFSIRGSIFTEWWTDSVDEPLKTYNPVWLPRQDQLQDLMLESENRVWRLQEWFNDWIPIGSKPKSFEQLWLAFTMSQLYNKVWSGTDWIKEDKE